MRANLGSPVDPKLARPESGSASLPAAPAPHLQTIDRGDEGAKAVPFHLVGPAWEGRERAGFGERLRPQPRSARSIPGLEPGCHRHHPQQFLSPISRSRADKGSTAENRRFGGRVDAPAADFLAPPEEGGGVWPGVGCLAAVSASDVSATDTVNHACAARTTRVQRDERAGALRAQTHGLAINPALRPAQTRQAERRPENDIREPAAACRDHAAGCAI